MCQYCEEPFDFLPAKTLSAGFNSKIDPVTWADLDSRYNEPPASKWISSGWYDDGATYYIWFCPICGRELPQD